MLEKKSTAFSSPHPPIKRLIMLLLELESGLMIRKPISVKDFAWENLIFPPLTVLHVHNIDQSAHYGKLAWARPPRPRAARFEAHVTTLENAQTKKYWQILAGAFFTTADFPGRLRSMEASGVKLADIAHLLKLLTRGLEALE